MVITRFYLIKSLTLKKVHLLYIIKAEQNIENIHWKIPCEVTDIPTTLSKDWILEGRQTAEIFWLNAKGYKNIINATSHIKKFYTNLIQNEQSNIIIYMSHFSNIFFPFGMKNLI